MERKQGIERKKWQHKSIRGSFGNTDQVLSNHKKRKENSVYEYLSIYLAILNYKVLCNDNRMPNYWVMKMKYEGLS